MGAQAQPQPQAQPQAQAQPPHSFVAVANAVLLIAS